MTTNYAKAKYTEIIDLQTTNNQVSIIGIHTPIGSKPRRMLNGFFSQFRKFRYAGCSLRMIPAAQLPIDPLGLSGIPGTTDVMDPRDALNPIIFHGCHGDHLGIILDTIYKEGRYVPFTKSGDSMDIQERSFRSGDLPLNFDEFYYAALSDPSWKKYGIQSGVSLKGLRPLVHKVALTKQMVPTSQAITIGYSGQDFGKLMPGDTAVAPTNSNTSEGPWDVGGLVSSGVLGTLEEAAPVEWSVNQMFTNGVTSLGWLPTTSWYHRTATNSSNNPSTSEVTYDYLQDFSHGNGTTTYLPKLFMGVLIMPPSYKCEQFFRCSITHYFEFKDFTTSLDPAAQLINYAYNDFIDHGDSKESAAKTVDDAINDTLELNTLDVIGGSVETVTSGIN